MKSMDKERNDKEPIQKLKTFWWLALSGVLTLWLYHWGSALYENQAQEYAQRGWFAHFFHYGDPHVTVFPFFIGGCVGIGLLNIPARAIARSHYDWIQKEQARRAQQATEAKFKQITSQSQAKSEQSQRVSSQEEVLSRLGVVDGFLFVLEGETDHAKRAISLQSSHAELLALEVKHKTGKIPTAVMADPDVVAHAQATSQHLIQLGLGEARLNLEILRLFNLPPG